MANGFILKLAALVGFVALLSGATYGAQQYIQPDAVPARGFVADALTAELAIAPGHAASVGVLLKNAGTAAETVTLRVRDGAGVVETTAPGAPLSVPPGGSAAALVPLAVAPGSAAKTVRVTIEAATQAEPVKRTTAIVNVRVLGDGPALGENASAHVYYVGRLADGSFFNTNLPGYTDAPFAHTAFYRPSSGNLTISTGDRANVIPGFWRGVLGMQAGETRTISIPHDQAYGPKRLTETEDRLSTIERRFELEVQKLERPFASFAQHIKDSGQGDAASFKVNDTFTLKQGANTWTFRLTSVNAQTVAYVPAPPVGTTFTLPSAPAWEGASVVESVDDTKIVFYTTPTTAIGEAFTFHEWWPGASAVKSLNETHVVVEHSPAVGFRYTKDGSPADGPGAHVVESVGAERITTSHPSPNPLAGEDLVFDVRVIRLLG